MKGNCYEAAKSRFWLISNAILIGNEGSYCEAEQRQIYLDKIRIENGRELLCYDAAFSIIHFN